MKGINNYTPLVGERCLISAPNMDNENGYVYSEFDVLWINETSILYGNKRCYPNLNKLEHVSIQQLKTGDFVDTDGKVHVHIRLIAWQTIHHLPGWYFIDETHDWSGPFSTLEECKSIFKRYCEKFLS